MRTPIAHRGLHAAHDGRPENSLAAFAYACERGFPAELDARLTRDGEVVVFHDRTLRRMTGADGRVEDRDAADVRALRLLGTRERVPLLRDVLELVDGRVPLLVEVKAGAPYPALERAVLGALDCYAGEVAIQSFKPRMLRELDRAEAPHAIGHLWRRRAPLATGPRIAFLGCHLDGLSSRAVPGAGAARAALRRQLHLRGLRAGRERERSSRQSPRKRGWRFSVKALAASAASAVWASIP
jgi:glycerophosphoryl diester phosphodiesterase